MTLKEKPEGPKGPRPAHLKTGQQQLLAAKGTLRDKSTWGCC